ncbi:hypothetical protein HAX54_044248 [Datura stramonium]|uniref:Uncharacterized protein n=1 Tax=Datura stramonium TaxID=4076 RepID=A0ABS8SPK3_DATST|nr:hypothetical protein [Datura stramonium]
MDHCEGNTRPTIIYCSPSNIDLLKSTRHPRHFSRHYSRRRSASNTEDQLPKLVICLLMMRKTNKSSSQNPEGELPSSSLATRVISSDDGEASFVYYAKKFLKKESSSLKTNRTVKMRQGSPTYIPICLGLVSQVVDASVEQD